jgi:geranylgeranyl pyrophosphate synthase
VGLDAHLKDALRHVLRNSGNLVRPRIVSQISTAFDLPEAHAKDLSAALEYFHTASLVFDDLPCMDNASQRRGATCVHLAFGESAAILAALALINRGYALVWRTACVWVLPGTKWINPFR